MDNFYCKETTFIMHPRKNRIQSKRYICTYHHCFARRWQPDPSAKQHSKTRLEQTFPNHLKNRPFTGCSERIAPSAIKGTMLWEIWKIAITQRPRKRPRFLFGSAANYGSCVDFVWLKAQHHPSVSSFSITPASLWAILLSI